MFKYLVISLALLFASPTLAASDPSKLVKNLGATVQINGNCSGTVIISRRDPKSGEVTTSILTAKHCVSDVPDRISKISVPSYDRSNRLTSNKVYQARVLGQWFKGDLSVLQLVDKDTLFENVAELAPATQTIPMGADTYTLGYPAGLSLTITEGTFGARESIPFPTASKDTEYFRATPAITGGNSGGALYYDHKLVGVTSVGHKSANQVGFYVPIDQIHDYLKIAVPELYTPKSP